MAYRGTFTAIIGDWHFWEGTQFMASDESKKELLAFKNVDDCINYLFLQRGDKPLARALNYAWQEHSKGRTLKAMAL